MNILQKIQKAPMNIHVLAMIKYGGHVRITHLMNGLEKLVIEHVEVNQTAQSVVSQNWKLQRMILSRSSI
jgi:hypothetical protein